MTLFSGVLVNLDTDTDRLGEVNDIRPVMGMFDANGLLVATVGNVENPSSVLVLADAFAGAELDDLDANDDNMIDNTAL